MSVERRKDHGVVRHRLVPAAVTFVVVAGAVYATAFVTLAILRHIIMPVLAVVVAVYAARAVFRLSGRSGHP